MATKEMHPLGERDEAFPNGCIFLHESRIPSDILKHLNQT